MPRKGCWITHQSYCFYLVISLLLASSQHELRNVSKKLKNNEAGKAKFLANKAATKPFLKDILRLTTLLCSTATLKLRNESKVNEP